MVPRLLELRLLGTAFLTAAIPFLPPEPNAKAWNPSLRGVCHRVHRPRRVCLTRTRPEHLQAAQGLEHVKAENTDTCPDTCPTWPWGVASPPSPGMLTGEMPSSRA